MFHAIQAVCVINMDTLIYADLYASVTAHNYKRPRGNIAFLCGASTKGIQCLPPVLCQWGEDKVRCRLLKTATRRGWLDPTKPPVQEPSRVLIVLRILMVCEFLFRRPQTCPTHTNSQSGHFYSGFQCPDPIQALLGDPTFPGDRCVFLRKT